MKSKFSDKIETNFYKRINFCTACSLSPHSGWGGEGFCCCYSHTSLMLQNEQHKICYCKAFLTNISQSKHSHIFTFINPFNIPYLQNSCGFVPRHAQIFVSNFGLILNYHVFGCQILYFVFSFLSPILMITNGFTFSRTNMKLF